jgi:hypothetical protein
MKRVLLSYEDTPIKLETGDKEDKMDIEILTGKEGVYGGTSVTRPEKICLRLFQYLSLTARGPHGAEVHTPDRICARTTSLNNPSRCDWLSKDKKLPESVTLREGCRMRMPAARIAKG